MSTVNEIHNGRDGDDDLDSGVQHYTRVFRVITDSNIVEAKDVLDLVDLPRIGTTYAQDTSATLQKRNASNQSFSKRVWLVTCSYSNAREQGEDPTADRAIVTWGTQAYQQVVYKDFNGLCVQNSAGDYYDPLPEKDDSRIVANISMNFSTIPTWILQYRDAVNDATFTLDGVFVPAGLAKISSIGIGEAQTRNTIPFRTLTMQMHFAMQAVVGDPSRGNEWHIVVLDAGFRERGPVPAGGGVAPMAEILNITAPVQLNGAGRVQANPTPANAIYRRFQVYPELDFSILPLP